MNVSSECRSEVSPLRSPCSVFERYLDVARAGRSQLAGRSLLQILTSSPNVKKFPPGDVVRNLLRVRLCPSHSARPQHALQCGSRSSRGRGSSVAPCLRLSLSCFASKIDGLFLNRAPPPPRAPRRSAPRPCVPSSIHQMRRSVLLNTYLRLCYSSCVWRGIHHLHCVHGRAVRRVAVGRRVKLDLTCAWLPFKTCRPCMLCRPTRGRAGRAGRFEGVARSRGRTRTGGHKG